MAAHDLRTPLTSIIGYIDIVNNMPDLSETTLRIPEDYMGEGSARN